MTRFEPDKIKREVVGVPPRPMLYTLDQIATLTGSDLRTMRKDRIFYDGVDAGIRHRKQMVARNIALESQPEDWRVAEQEFFRWLRICGFRIMERGWIRD